MAEVNISKDLYRRIAVSLPYDSSIITKIKTIEGRRWHPVEKHWTFPTHLPLSPCACLHEAFRRRQGRGKGEGYHFEDPRRELVPRK
jgi:hypothetical protein